MSITEEDFENIESELYNLIDTIKWLKKEACDEISRLEQENQNLRDDAEDLARDIVVT